MADQFTYDVFLSHNNADKWRVRKLAEQLNDAGLRVWFDEWVIQPGDDVYLAVERGLEASRTMVLCLSQYALGSGWVTLERSTVLFRDPENTKRRFIPLLLADCQLPDSLARFKYLDFRGQNESAFKKLVETCRAPQQEVGSARSAGSPSTTKSDAASRQRICMISSEYPPHVLGGLGVHVTQLSEGLAAKANIYLILPHQKSGYAAPPAGIKTQAMSRVGASYDDPISWLHFSQHVFNVFRNIIPRPEVIHCHDWVTVLGGIKCRFKLKIPLLFHVHLPNRSPFCSSVENLGLLCADLVTVNSEAMREQLKDRFPDKEVAVVPNGVDTRMFSPADPKADADRYVLFAGRLVEQKGVDQLLRAFVHIEKRFPALELWIVGSGPCDLGYRRMADCLLIGEKVRFLGWRGGLELSKLYQGASVVALPSIYEPFGMTALEAMACARPVVASRTGGLSEIIQHGVTGCLVEPGDHLDLAQWIIRLLDRKDLRQELGTNAGRMVHESNQYQWPSIAGQYAAFYQTLSREPPDLKMPKEAGEYVQQIKSLAKGLDRTSEGMCYDLFDWMR